MNQKLLKKKKSLKIQRDFLKTIYKKYPSLVWSRIIPSVWQAITPYVEIFFMALIIGELSGGRNPEKLMKFVLLSLFVTAIMGIINGLLTKWKNVQEKMDYYNLSYMQTEKILNMDFVSVDDIKTHELFSKIRQNYHSSGYGAHRFLFGLEDLSNSLASIIAGLVLSLSLFTLPVKETGGLYDLLNKPWVTAVIIAGMIIISILPARLYAKAQEYWDNNADNQQLGNRLFAFYGCFGIDNKYALDSRMYNQQNICVRFNKDKTDMFLSKGLFMKTAKGPQGAYNAAGAASSMIFTAFAYLYIGIKALGGAFGLGAVTQYVSAILKLSTGFQNFIKTSKLMDSNALFLETELEFLNLPNPMYQGSLTVEKRNDRNYEVEFKNVSFKYPGSENYALKNINMKFNIGERLAVVGENGSGKTTFIKLLCRLYDPTEGEILLNGINIRKYNYLDYLMIFSVVFQDFKLMSLKLGSNVSCSEDYDEERAKECLEKAGLGDRLKTLPDGLDTYLYKDYEKDGIDVSGGEAQKIAIARTLYKDAPFIILDEPTAALDPVAEAEIYSRFNDIAGDKTAVYISHRLSSCRFCDEILVFDKGRIVQQGSHERLLLDQQGKYTQLWNAQAQYYA